jgi:hypothetical protein
MKELPRVGSAAIVRSRDVHCTNKEMKGKKDKMDELKRGQVMIFVK